MRQVLIGQRPSTPSNGNINYTVLGGDRAWDAAEVYVPQLIATPGKISSLLVNLTVAPGAGKSYTFVLRVNNGNTALTVTISDAATQGWDITHEVAVVGGDQVGIMCTPAGTPAATGVWFSSIFVGDNPNESLILGNGYGFLPPLNSTWYNYIQRGGTYDTEINRKAIIPTSGKIKYFYVRQLPIASTQAETYCIRINGANSTLVVPLGSDVIAGSDLIHEVAVAAGDTIAIQVTQTGRQRAFTWGLCFVADIDGEFLHMGGETSPDTVAVRYSSVIALNCGWSGAEGITRQQCQAMTYKKFYMGLLVAPGAGKSWTFTIRKNMDSTPVVVTISGLDTTGNDTVNEALFADGDTVDVMVTPAGTPAATGVYMGLLGYVPPAGGMGGVGPNMASRLVAAELI